MTPTASSNVIEAPCGPVLITGGNAMLAWDLLRTFQRAFPKNCVFALGRDGLDICSESSIQSALEKHRPAWILNCAAYTNVDGAESQREEAENINFRGAALLARIAHGHHAKLIHFSTDQVFDGQANYPRTEQELPSPANYYAATKLRGEESVLAHRGSLVLRVQWLYGQHKDRFSPLRRKTVFTPFADQFGAPTWTRKIAESLVALLSAKAEGLFHFSYDDYASWAEVFQFVKEQWDLPVVLDPKLTSDLKLPAQRPLFSVLSNEKLRRFLGVSAMGSWKTPLLEFLKECQAATSRKVF